MKEPKVVERFADNGEHSHWELIDTETGKIMWQELSPEDEVIVIEGRKFRKGDIYDIYECERNKKMFLNREAGFVVELYGDKDRNTKYFKFSESIPYETTNWEIYNKKKEWECRMNKAISLWKQKQ